MPIYFSGMRGNKSSEVKPGDSICDCCGTRIADPNNGMDQEWRDDENGDEYLFYTPLGFLDGRQGIFIQEGEIEIPQDNGKYVVDHIKTKNGMISVKVEYVW